MKKIWVPPIKEIVFKEGEFLNGKRNGKGKEIKKEKIFEGEYLNGIRKRI